MDVDELLTLDRPLTNVEMALAEQKVLELAHGFRGEVEKLTANLDADDPDMTKLHEASAKMTHNIEMAIACDEKKGEKDPYRSTLMPPVYEWEKLPVYEWINSFARVVGRLLATLPGKLHIHAHNLAGQTCLISNCIALGHRDAAPGEVISRDELLAYRRIGLHATTTVSAMLEELTKVTKRGSKDIAHGVMLMGKIRAQFEADVAELERTTRPPELVH